MRWIAIVGLMVSSLSVTAAQADDCPRRVQGRCVYTQQELDQRARDAAKKRDEQQPPPKAQDTPAQKPLEVRCGVPMPEALTVAADIRKDVMRGIQAAKLDLSGGAFEEDTRRMLDGLKRKIDTVHCFEAAPDQELDAAFIAFRSRVEGALVQERTCRASKECMLKREILNITLEICEDVQDRNEAAAAMKAERANPSGVVDLALLHDLGARIQSDNVQIAQGKADYQRVAKKPFNEALCK